MKTNIVDQEKRVGKGDINSSKCRRKDDDFELKENTLILATITKIIH